MWPSETSIAVRVVPMLAPMIMKTAASISSAPPATIPTMMEVEVEELWTREVARMPMKRAAKGFSVTARTLLAKSLPNILKASPMPVTPTMNR